MAKPIADEKFSAIIEAICFWLGYQFKIKRDRLIHEASLRYPIADTLTAHGIAMRQIALEKQHPLFIKRSIDLVVYQREVANTDKGQDALLKEFYEFKLAKSGTAKPRDEEHQRVFNDVVRLAYLHQQQRKECYFLMCGRYNDFKTYFVGQKSNLTSLQSQGNVTQPKTATAKATNKAKDEWLANGLYKDWFDFKPYGSKIITFDTNQQDGLLTEFQTTYKLQNGYQNLYASTIKVKTTCVGIVPASSKNRTHAAGIWKIEAV